MSKIKITAVKLDVSKGKSSVAARRIGGEIRVVMEHVMLLYNFSDNFTRKVKINRVVL